MKHTKGLRNKQFVRFLIAGGLAALVNFGSRFFYSHYLIFELAVVLAYLTGMLTAFVLMKFFIFEHSGQGWKTETLRFAMVNGFALVQTWLISVLLARWWLVDWLGVSLGEALAHLVGIAVPVFSSYFGHKYFTFRKA